MKCPHCDIHVDEHEASRCLDAWVAEVVMELCSHFLEFEWTDEKGDRWCKCQKCGETIKHPELKLYSEDISAAWKLVEKIELHFVRRAWDMERERIGWLAWVDSESHSTAPTPALAICRAAIKATHNAR